MADIFDPFKVSGAVSENNEGIADPFAAGYEKPSVVGTSIKRSVGNVIGSTGRALKDVTDVGGIASGIQHYGEDLAARNPALVTDIQGIKDNPGTFAKQAIAEMAPQLGINMAGVAAGAKLGSRIGGGRGAILGGIAGGLVPTFAQEYGGIRQGQDEEGIDDKGRALTGALPATALELALGPEAIIAKNILKSGGKVTEEGLAKMLGRDLAPGESRLAHMGKEALKSAAGEGVTEVAQTGLERYGAGQELTGDDATNDYVMSGLAGGIGGGVFGGAASGFTPREKQNKVDPIAAQRNADIADVAQAAQQPGAGALTKAVGLNPDAAAAVGDQQQARQDAALNEKVEQSPGKAKSLQKEFTDLQKREADDATAQANVESAFDDATLPSARGIEVSEVPSSNITLDSGDRFKQPTAEGIEVGTVQAEDAGQMPGVQAQLALPAPARDMVVGPDGAARRATFAENASAQQQRAEADLISGRPTGIKAPPSEVRNPKDNQPWKSYLGASAFLKKMDDGDQFAVSRVEKGQFVLARKEAVNGEQINASKVAPAGNGRQSDNASTGAANSQAELRNTAQRIGDDAARTGSGNAAPASVGVTKSQQPNPLIASDISRPDGSPFPTKIAATGARAKGGQKETHTIHPVEGGFVLRPNAAPISNEVKANVPQQNQQQQEAAISTGEGQQASAQEKAPVVPASEGTGNRSDVNSDEPEFKQFAKESGTLGVPRAEMPQVKAEHRGALVNFLKGRGISHEQEEVAPETLKATQAEYSPSKVEKAKNFEGGDRSILISSDNHVVDGHHQWLAKADSKEPVKVIRLDSPIKDLLPLVKEFPSSTKDESSASKGQDVRKAADLTKAAHEFAASNPEVQKAASSRTAFDEALPEALNQWYNDTVDGPTKAKDHKFLKEVLTAQKTLNDESWRENIFNETRKRVGLPAHDSKGKGQIRTLLDPSAIGLDDDWKGKQFKVGEWEGGSGFKRATRPVAENNPDPDLDSNDFPPTFKDAHEVEKAFGLPFSTRPEPKEKVKGKAATTQAQKSPVQNGKKLTPSDDARLKDQSYHDKLREMANEAGWATVGGRILRGPDNEVSGRTTWVPHAPWFAEFARGVKLPGSDYGVRQAVTKALDGKPLTASEKRAIQWMLDFVDSGRAEDAAFDAANSVDPFDPTLADHLEAAGADASNEDDLQIAALTAQAHDIDADATEEAAIRHQDDDAGYRRALEEIVNGTESKQNQSAETLRSGSGVREGSQSQGSRQHSEANSEGQGSSGQVDLFGAAPVKEQALADAQRAKDAQRNGTKDVPADIDGGLFSNQQKQTDLVDESDLAERTKANIAGETQARASLIILRDMLDAGSDTMNDGQFSPSITEQASQLSDRITAALDNGDDLISIHSDAVETVSEWLKNDDAGEATNELRGILKALGASSIAPPATSANGEQSPTLKALQANLENLTTKRERMQTQHMQKYRDGSATRAQTTTYNARSSDLNEQIQEVRDQIRALESASNVKTAPEHNAYPTEGASEADLKKIAAEFSDAQESMINGDDQVTHVFDAPKKSEIVRLNDKVKVHVSKHGWMTPAEAKQKIKEWKQHAEKQGKENRSENSQKVVLSLFDLSGEWSKPWEEAGYQVYRFDIQDDAEVGDVTNFSADFFGDWFGDFEGQDIHAILAACPCTDFASSGARHFAAKDSDGRTVSSVKLVHQTLATIEYFKPAVWALENPVGRIESLGGLPPWRTSFDPYNFGDTYTKKTLLWGRFDGDMPIAPVEPVEGSKMHTQYGGKSQATKNARSVTPEGFAYAFFMANNAVDNPVQAVAGKYDRLDRSAIKDALDAGITPKEIDSIVEDFYYQDLDDDAANKALREAVEAKKPNEDPVEAKIEAAEKSGVVLNDSDKNAIRMAFKKADELQRKANGIVGRSSDPMNKGNAFPLGVGFTKMTKRKEQAIDSSVKKAGIAVGIYKQAESLEAQANSLLAGKGTSADIARRAEAKEKSKIEIVRKILNLKKGDKIAGMNVERVTFGAGKQPVSFTISGEGIVKGVHDKIDIAKTFFGGDRDELRKVVDQVRAETTETESNAAVETAPDSAFKTADETIAALRDGTATVEQYRSAFTALIDNVASVKAELAGKNKDALYDLIGGRGYGREYKKPELVDQVYQAFVRSFALGKEYGPTGYMMAPGALERHEAAKLKALTELVNGQSAESLAEYAADMKKKREEFASQRAARVESIKSPKTLEDFYAFMRFHTGEGKKHRDARLMLTPEQREAYDALSAEKSRSTRKVQKDESREIRVAGQKVDAEIIATKHTKKLHDLFVVRLGERVPREDYDTLNTAAKRMGGYYSSFRGAGAIAGFQFTDRPTAEAFVKLANGDATAANETAQTRRDAFQDDRSQTAVERLTEMADALEERADESLNADRKTNTNRRAAMASRAEANANASKALAKTMRNIAKAVESGKAKFLDRVRQKTQVELLTTTINTAKDDELRAKYDSYGEQLKHKGEPATSDTVEFATFPSFTMYRSDLASLARQLEDVDGLKLISTRLLKVADDVSDEYTKFAKANWEKVSPYTINDGKPAVIPTREAAETAIRRSGLLGKAIVMPLGRGKNAIVMSPSEAIGRGIWKGDGDKRISLVHEIGNEIVTKLKGRKDVPAPWQFVSASDKLKTLARMGIETPAEYRSALREFIGLREQAAEPDKIKQMERAMVGRRNDGLDFFPTPETTADEMVDAAGIEPGMRVLEPSAGMGHIADRIRAAGVEPDVVEMSGDRRELLEAKGFNVVGSDTMDLKPETAGQYDRIIMNPPFSDGRDMQHVRHAYDLLKPEGRLIAIMGEGAFFRDNKQAREFREWLESVGGTDEKLAEGTFEDPTLPVNTSVNARMVVIEKPAGETPEFRMSPSYNTVQQSTTAEVLKALNDKLGAAGVKSLMDRGILNIVQSADDLPSTMRAKMSSQIAGRVRGLYDGKAAYIVADNIEASEAISIVLHEIGEHYGLKQMLGADQYSKLLNDVRRMRAAGNPIVRSAWNRVERNYKNITPGSDRFVREVIAHVGESAEASSAPWFQRVMQAIRQFLWSKGFKFIKLDHNDLRAMVSASLRKAMAGMNAATAEAGQSLKESNIKQTDTPAFKKWFGASKVIDANGEPLIVYHGTDSDFDAFDKKRQREGRLGKGFYFTSSPEEAKVYGKNVIPVYLQIDRLYNGRTRETIGSGKTHGIEYSLTKGGGRVFLVQGSEQIKSASGNRGTFNPNDSRIDFSLKGKYGSDRADWNGFPPVHRMQPLGAAQKHADYVAAKAGDPAAAYRVAHDLLDDKKLEELSKALGDSSPTVVPVQSVEATGRNMLPRAYAELLGQKLGLPVDENIMQSVRAFHTNANAYERIASQPAFDGDVKKGGNYLIVDDTQTIGGTLANLRGHIEANGGHVILASALTGHESTADITLRPAMRDKLLAKHGAKLDDYLHENFGFGIDQLTQGEAGHLAAAPSLDAVRDRIAEGRRTLGLEDDQSADRSGQESGQVLGKDEPMYSLADARAPEAIGDIRQRIGDMLDNRRTFNRWWHETVGTQYHKAQVDKDYGRVYNRTQEYLTDVSRFALGAADLASDILPKFESFSDLTKSGASPRELKPVADAIFRGTLEDQKHYTESELRDRFNLNPKQIRLYQQARTAINKSLSDVAITDMVKLARPNISDAVAREAAAAGSMRAARNLLVNSAPALADDFDQKIGRVNQLISEGYAPLMRFGEYSLHVTDKAGETVYFSMFENAADRNRMERLMQEQYPDALIKSGVVNDETYQMFKGMTPETLELFAGVTGMDKDDAFQQYLKLAKNNRSALKRLIHRKGIEGYNPDLKRVLAQFITSNARAASSGLHMGEMTKAWEAIPKEKGDVQKQAGRLIQYIQNPREEAQGLRSFLFFNFLGGSVASAMVNMTQPVTMSMPYLSQWGAGSAAKELAAGMKIAMQRPEAISDAGLRAAMQRAIKDGTVEPHQIHELTAASMRSEGDWGKFDKARELGNKGLFIWGRMFSLAEQFNRRSTFAAAYQIGRKLSGEQLAAARATDAYDFAAKAVHETQGVYNRGNRPNWARGAVGATVFTFKQYSISYLEFVKRLPRKQQLMTLGVLVLSAGVNGFPGAEDLDDLIDTIAQGLGLSWNTKEERNKAISAVITPIFGQGATEFAQSGVSTFLPIDVAGRMGMGNLIPGTGIGLKSQNDKGREFAEAVGPIGGLAKNYGKSAADLLSGDISGAVKSAMPNALQNAINGYQMAQLGYARDDKGRRVIDTTTADAVSKAIGFNPRKVAVESRAVEIKRQDIDLNRATSSEIAEEWAQGIFEHDQDKVNKARAKLMRWNAKNPDSRILIAPSSIQQRVKQMTMTRAQRFIKSAPKGMRAEVSDALKDQ
ncbi:MAG: PLxRFG domain-containing protein [Pseudomonadota bacterium]